MPIQCNVNQLIIAVATGANHVTLMDQSIREDFLCHTVAVHCNRNQLVTDHCGHGWAMSLTGQPNREDICMTHFALLVCGQKACPSDWRCEVLFWHAFSSAFCFCTCPTNAQLPVMCNHLNSAWSSKWMEIFLNCSNFSIALVLCVKQALPHIWQYCMMPTLREPLKWMTSHFVYIGISKVLRLKTKRKHTLRRALLQLEYCIADVTKQNYQL